jgi:hypothetical protein
MATVSILDEIIDNLKATCEGITIANGYNQNVKLVKTGNFQLPDQFRASELPAIQIIDDESAKEEYDVDSTKAILSIIVEGIIRRSSRSQDVQEDRRKLQRDIEKALMVDESRGGYAVFTKARGIRTDKGTVEPFSICEMDFIIEYYYNRGDPASQDNSPMG